MIQLDGLTKSFGDRRVLDGVTLDVPDGENTVIIGYSGSGKSVTLKCIVGLLEPDAGRAIVDGAVVGDLDHDQLTELRGHIGYVFQFAALFDSMTVAENIALGLARRGHDPDTIAERIADSLAVVDLSGTEDKYPAQLSGGMDDVQAPHIRQWERDFLEYLEAQHPAVLNDLRTKKALDDDLTNRLKAALAAFKPLFVAD